jgi:hypothetical protein
VRAAVSCAARTQFGQRHPHGAHDAVVEAARRVGRADVAAECETDESHILVARRTLEAREIDADQAVRREGAARLLQHLADHALLGRFLRVEVAGRVVELQALGRVLLDEQELRHVADASLDDRGNGDTRFPALGHGGILAMHESCVSSAKIQKSKRLRRHPC